MTIQFLTTKIHTLAIHRVGNRQHEDGYFLSKRVTQIRDDVEHQLLLKFFTQPFSNPEFYQFHHPTSMEQNDVYSIAKNLFEKKQNFLEASQDLGKILYSKTNHPKVVGGELYVAYFENIDVNGLMTNAIGLFKSETKTPFMKLQHQSDIYEYEFDEGINLNAIDKACIILNHSTEDGYRVCIHDRQGKSEEALYWKHEFLSLKPCADDYHKTKQFMSLCKDYIKDKLPQEFEVEKTDQIEMLNNSVAFFKANEQFDYENFSREVIREPGIMKSFDRFKNEFEAQNELSIGTDFDISPQAVKSQSRVFKSVLKLDKNFHVYVHGNKEMIEKGYDEEKGMSFYKLYFREES